MKAFVLPGQGSQHVGMGKDLHDESEIARFMFAKSNEILGFDITKIMFEGEIEELKQTNVTQPAIFIHSVILATCMEDKFNPDMVAGHSLGEFSALVATKALTFEDGLALVSKRANAMQKACGLADSTMAAILMLEDEVVEKICEGIDGVVVTANYNCPGQLVISGATEAVKAACEELAAAGAKRTILLPVSGGFHSPMMEPAKLELEEAINNTAFVAPSCPIYQNVPASAVTDPETIKKNLIAQLTAPVRWTQTINNMVADGGNLFTEAGPGKVLIGLSRKINRELETVHATDL